MKAGILTESTATDDQVYGALLRGILGEEVTFVAFEHTGGIDSVSRVLPAAIARFAQEHVDIAFVALDNDQPPSHLEAHELDPRAFRENCRTCGLSMRLHEQAVPNDAFRAVAVVPVPAIEAWLAAAKGVHENPEYEDKRTLKYLVYRSAAARKKRVLETGVPLAKQIGEDLEVRSLVRARCSSFATFLRALGRALPGRLTTSSAPPPT